MYMFNLSLIEGGKTDNSLTSEIQLAGLERLKIL